MKIATFNVNGLRAAIRKGFREWLLATDIDVVCLQETKAQMKKLSPDEYAVEGYACVYEDAEKAGYSGVAIYSRLAIESSKLPIWEHTHVQGEGRFIAACIQGINIINIYMPSGTSGDARQEIKWALMQDFRNYLKKIQHEPVVILGDINVAHTTRDIKNWKSNTKNSGFLPHERAWMGDMLLDGWADTLRVIAPDEEVYTWWSTRTAARERNVGWRIDYQFIAQSRNGSIRSAIVDATPLLSDHAPYVVEYDYEKFFDTTLPSDS